MTSIVVNMREAKDQLSKLITRAGSGEEVTIARRGEPVARLVPIEPSRRLFGLDEGKVTIHDSFFDPLPDEFTGI